MASSSPTTPVNPVLGDGLLTKLMECQSETDSPPSAAMGALGSGSPSPSPGWRWRSGIDSARRPMQTCACTRILFPSAPRWLSPTWQRLAEHDLRRSSSTISLMRQLAGASSVHWVRLSSSCFGHWGTLCGAAFLCTQLQSSDWRNMNIFKPEERYKINCTTFLWLTQPHINTGLWLHRLTFPISLNMDKATRLCTSAVKSQVETVLQQKSGSLAKRLSIPSIYLKKSQVQTLEKVTEMA